MIADGTEELELLEVRPGICFGALGPVFLLYYRTSPTVADLELRVPLLDRITEENPSGGAFLSVIETGYGSALPGPEARALTARQVEERSGVLRFGAIVILGDGVRATLVRTVLRSLLFLRRGPMQMRFSANTLEAASACLVALGYQGEALREGTFALVRAVEQLADAAGYPDEG